MKGKAGMKVVVISDTHGDHRKLGVLEGDVLVHCGDFEDLFGPDDQMLDDVDAWFGEQRFELILCTGGNHDLALEQRLMAGQAPFQNALFLLDETVTFHGLKFHGAPWVPQLSGHAFFADRPALTAAWSRIPDDVDVLITHTPPRGALDVSSRGLVLGCEALAARLEMLSPRLHCFGHVHAGRGQEHRHGTTYVNATSVNSHFEIAHPPVFIEL